MEFNSVGVNATTSKRLIDKLHLREQLRLQACQRARELDLTTLFNCEAPMVGILWSNFRKLGRIPRSDHAAEQKL